MSTTTIEENAGETRKQALLEKIKGIYSNQGFQRYFKNTFWLFSEQILRLVSGLFVGVWVARYLGPDQFGIYNYAIAFTALFGGIAKLGLDGIMVRELVKNPDKRVLLLGTSFWLKLIGAAVTFCIIFLITLFNSYDKRTNIYLLIIASGMIFQGFEVIDYYFQSEVLAKYVSICRISQLIVSSSVKIFLVLNHAELIWFVIIILMDQITLAVCLFIAYCSKKTSMFFTSFDVPIAKKLLRDSWPLIINSLVVTLYMRIDQIMIKHMQGEAAVGLYSAAVRLSEIWYFIPMILTNSLFPAIVKSREIDRSLYYKRLQSLYCLLIWLTIVIAVPMTFFSDWLINFLFGTQFQEASTVLMVHIWTGIFVGFGVARGKWLLAENLQKLASSYLVIGMLVNIVLNFLLIPKYSILGAAVATLISQSVVGVFAPLLFKETRFTLTAFLRALAFQINIRKTYL